MEWESPRTIYWLQLEKVALSDALDFLLQSSDFFSESNSSGSLSRSISSNISEVGIDDDLTELEDAEMLSSFQSTHGK